MNISKSATRALLSFLTERETIRQRKLVPDACPPYTKDPVLRKYRFCNVRRADDAVSIWLRTKWYPYVHGFPAHHQIAAAAMARMINSPDTLANLTYPRNSHDWRSVAFGWRTVRAELRENGKAFFHPAYIINGSNTVQLGTGDKIGLVARNVLSLRDQAKRREFINMIDTWVWLKTQSGVGTFIAGQIVADLRWVLLSHACDARQFTPLGPGSKRGMNRLFGRPVSAPLSQAVFNHLMQASVLPLIDSVPLLCELKLEGIDYQNCLCEFDKYMRTVLGEGTPKRHYR
jgi:hypothetical protein